MDDNAECWDDDFAEEVASESRTKFAQDICAAEAEEDADWGNFAHGLSSAAGIRTLSPECSRLCTHDEFKVSGQLNTVDTHESQVPQFPLAGSFSDVGLERTDDARVDGGGCQRPRIGRGYRRRRRQ